ncbi:hypothetical protein JOD18_000608 [Gracilibacillus alcaliphilus]|nr:hypothetical protein [Gracilibacillus alcaliphilus]
MYRFYRLYLPNRLKGLIDDVSQQNNNDNKSCIIFSSKEMIYSVVIRELLHNVHVVTAFLYVGWFILIMVCDGKEPAHKTSFFHFLSRFH